MNDRNFVAKIEPTATDSLTWNVHVEPFLNMELENIDGQDRIVVTGWWAPKDADTIGKATFKKALRDKGVVDDEILETQWIRYRDTLVPTKEIRRVEVPYKAHIAAVTAPVFCRLSMNVLGDGSATPG